MITEKQVTESREIVDRYVNHLRLNLPDYRNIKDDLRSEGYLGVEIAKRYFNEDYGVKFETYATTVAKQRIYFFLNKLPQTNGVISLDPNEIDGVSAFVGVNSLDYTNPLEVLIELERNEKIRRYIDILPERMSTVIKAKFFKFKKNKEIAEQLGTTESMVKFLFTCASKELYERMDNSRELKDIIKNIKKY